MSENEIKLFFALLRSVINGNELSEWEKELYDGEMLVEMLKLSKRHDVTHLLSQGLVQNSLLENNNNANNEIFKAVYRYEQIKYEYENLCSALEKAEIPFIPLKGAVLRNYYPEPWMRTSCDIDVLIHTEDVDKAVSWLVNNCGYTRGGECTHDVSFYSPGQVHIELHFDLLEGGIANSSSEVLQSVWENSVVKNGSRYFYEMSDEMFYFYHIAHMAKHFENGGCGIRPLIDLWILDNIEKADKDKRDQLLEQGDLIKFSSAVRELSKVWFEGAEYSELTKQTENYILSGGVYGTNENRVVVQQQKRGGRFKYVIYKVFLPYDVMKSYYPILKKHRWLTPIMEIRRWFRLIFKGNGNRAVKELKQVGNMSQEQVENTRQFLKNLGL